MLNKFLNKLRERQEAEHHYKFILVQAKLTDYFEVVNQGINIPAWYSAQLKAEEWEREGIIEEQYQKLLKYKVA